MTNEDDSAPAVWDPTARDGAGGWVRRSDSRTHRLRKPTPAPAPPPDQADEDEAPTQLLPPQGAGPSTPGPSLPPSPGDQPTARLRPVPPVDPPRAVPTPPGYGYPGPAPARPAYSPAPPGTGPYGGEGVDPYGPYPPQAPPPPAAEPAAAGRRRRTPLLVLLAVVLVAGIGGGVVWAVQGGGRGHSAASGPSGGVSQSPSAGGASSPAASASAPASGEPVSASPSGSGSPSPTSTAEAAAQAKRLDALLTRNAGARQEVGNAVATVQSCPQVSVMRDAAKVFDEAARQHEQLIAELNRLDLSQVAGGPEAVQLLRTAWQQSAQADRAYGRWAAAVIGQGCAGGTAPRTADREQADQVSGEATRSKQTFVTQWNPIADRYGLSSRTGDGI